MAFTFGTTTSAPAPAGGGGFSFGGGTPAPAAPASTAAFGASSTPATSAFSFGGGTPAPAASTSSGTQTPAPAPSAFSFGGATTSSTPAAAPATTTSAFGSSTSSTFGGTTSTSTSAFGTTAAAATAPSSQPQQTGPQPVLTVPEFDTTFSNFQLQSQVEGLLQKLESVSADEARLAGQELIHLLSGSGSVAESLLQLTPLTFTPPNPQLRQQLQQTPFVQLYGQDASLTPHMLQQVFDLASALLISEPDSLCLVAAVASQEVDISDSSSVLDQALLQANSNSQSNKTPSFSLHHLPLKAKLARDVYFRERSSRLQLLLKLLQSRLQGNAFLLQATDELLQKGLFTNLISLIRQWTELIQKLQHEVEATKENTSSQSMMMDDDKTKQTKQQPLNFRRVHLLHAIQERQVAAECVFYICYHTQLTAAEVGALLDLIQDLSCQQAPLNPLTDVPHPYELTSQNNQQWPAPPQFATDKDELQWQTELIQQTWESRQPQLLQCLAPLMVSVVCALDATHELHDRMTHAVNAFGVVRVI